MNIVVGAIGLTAITLNDYLDDPEQYKPHDEWNGRELVTIQPMTTIPNIERYSSYLQNFNTGIMRALQANPDDLKTTCIDKTYSTNISINNMFIQSNYTNQKFNSGDFFDFLQVNNLNFMD